MSLPELQIPIRLYWDLTPLPAQPLDYGRICGEIAALKILSVDLTATGPALPQACLTVLMGLAAARVAVTLTVSPQALPAAAESLAAATLAALLVEIDRAAALDSLDIPLPLRQRPLGISFPVTAANWQELPELVGNVASLGFSRLVLPMQRLYSGEAAFHLPRTELTTLASRFAAMELPAALRITAHDPFLWKAIFPDQAFPEGRCQAANTMVAVAADGGVYPCPVMPVLLGSLREHSLREIVMGDGKRELRARLLQPPQHCLECGELSGCHGACRGRGEYATGSWEEPDPGCR
jgi:GeoRSP system SPASM domain protein